MIPHERFKQDGPLDQAIVVLAAIEGGIDNLKDSIPTNLDNLSLYIEDLKILIQYLPTKWKDI